MTRYSQEFSVQNDCNHIYSVPTSVIIYPLAVIHLISSWKSISYSLTIDQQERQWQVDPNTESQIQHPHTSDIRYTHTYYVLNSYHLCQLIYIMVSCLLFLPWCTAITGYRISSNNSNSQQQPTIGYRQTSKSPSGMSQPTIVKATANRIYA